MTPTLYLASSSPRRQQILAALGLTFEVRSREVDETPLAAESPEDMVLRLARAKALALDVGESDVVIGADTAVVVDHVALGKPRDEEDAVAMLMRLSGRQHSVITGVAVRGANGVQAVLSATDVQFRDISRDEARAYWQSGEPRDKAGAYAIQGIGGAFVENIEGSYSGVVGLPVFETIKLLHAVGVHVLPPQVRDEDNDR